MRIKKVRIQNFKRYDFLEVEVHSLDCLVGANNSGKTTMLQALALFGFCLQHCLHRKNGELELRRRTIAPEEFYVLPVSNPVDLWTDRKTMAGNKQKRIRISVDFDSGDSVTAIVKLDFNRFGIAIDANDDSQEALARYEQVRLAYLPVFSTFLAQEDRRLKIAIEDELSRGRVNAVVRNLLLELKHEKRDHMLVEVLQRSFPNLQSLKIDFDEVTDRYVSVTYKEKGRPKAFDIFSAGSGFQQFLYLFGFVFLRQPTVLLLDEPDVHLHGSLQASLLSEMRQLVDSGRQVLFATHSRELITRVGPEDILSLGTESNQRLRISYDLYDVLDRLGAIDPTQLGAVQAFRKVVVVEDRTDRDLIRQFCATCLGEDIWQQIERRIAFCFARGNPWKQHDMTRLREILQQMIAIEGAPLELFVIADRDYYPDLASLRDRLKHAHTRWHVWERAEIENYLLCKNAVCRVVRDSGESPTLFESSLRTKFEDFVEQSRNRASDRLVTAFSEQRRHLKELWEPATMARMAREFLELHWEKEKLSLADAKDVVLPAIKRWCQETFGGQFSNQRLAQTLTKEEFPDEVHHLAQELAKFAGIATAPHR